MTDELNHVPDICPSTVRRNLMAMRPRSKKDDETRNAAYVLIRSQEATIIQQRKQLAKLNTRATPVQEPVKVKLPQRWAVRTEDQFPVPTGVYMELNEVLAALKVAGISVMP